MGLKGNDRLVNLREANGLKTDRRRKSIIETLITISFQINIATHLKETNFLGVAFIVTYGINCPNKISNNHPLKINKGYDMIHQTK